MISVAVGSNDDIGNLAGAGTQRIDARGMTVAWLDAHGHPDLRADFARVSVVRLFRAPFVFSQ